MSKSKGIFLDKNLLRSEAFRSLDKWSLLVYLDFLRKRKMSEVKRSKRSSVWIIENNGEIVYPYSEAEHKGIGRGSFRTAIDKLIAHGFLDITHQGTAAAREMLPPIRLMTGGKNTALRISALQRILARKIPGKVEVGLR